MNDFPAIVIDNGSGSMRGGLSGEELPQLIFPTCVEQPRRNNLLIGLNNHYRRHVGKDALAKRGIMTIKSPLEKGIIRNFDEMEHIWQYLFVKQMKKEPEEQPMIMTEVCWNPKENREKTTQMMFEIFNLIHFQLSNQSALSIYASGRTSGIVLDCGQTKTSSVAVYEGLAFSDSASFVDYSGSQLTDQIFKLLNEKSISFTPSSYNREAINQAKEQHCYAALNFGAEMQKEESLLEKSFQLPDGETITIGKERFKAVEPYFDSTILNLKNCVQNSIFFPIFQNDFSISSLFYSNIILSGGCSLFPGMPERIEKELRLNFEKIKVVAPPHRHHSAWIGASLFSSLSTFKAFCISKEEYDEYGPPIVNTKCF